MTEPVLLYDTTLRDGTQREGLVLSLADKLKIARRLDEAGFPYVEGGWPGSNPKDEEFFAAARTMTWQTARLAAFGSTRHRANTPADDPNLRALVEAATPVVTIFGKSWLLHVIEVLGATPDENLAMVGDSVAFLRAAGREVVYDAEHFFDGYKSDPSYALATLRAARAGGATTLVLCDTNGGCITDEVREIVTAVIGELSADGGPATRFGIHVHEDAGLSVANSLAAVQAGVTHVQGTVNGYGERCGNANLCALLPDLELKLGMTCLPPGKLRELTDVAHFVSEVANLVPDEHMAYVGKSAFAHKGGVHVAAMRRSVDSYQHIDPELVGNASRAVLSELAGRGNVLSKAEELGMQLVEGAEVELVGRIKQREAGGFSFEAAEASTALLLRRETNSYRPPFRLIEYRVMTGQAEGGAAFTEATIKIAVGSSIVHTAAEGNGPVSALDAALRKALEPAFPGVRDIQLVDYKVRILDGRDGTSATTRVLIDSSDGARSWSTAGASANILEASWQALADSIEYGLQDVAAAAEAS